MFWVKATLLIHALIQSLLLILIGLVSSLPKQDILVLTDFTKSELISLMSAIALVWQFFMAIIFFVVPPFAYKNQMLDLTILLAYPCLSLYMFLVDRYTLTTLINAPALWLMIFLGIIYYFVSILDLTGPVVTKPKKR
jgi:hypothetical protein